MPGQELSIISVEGIQETCSILDRLPKTLVARGFVNALDAAGQVFVRALWPNVPVDMKAAMNRSHGGKRASKVFRTNAGGEISDLAAEVSVKGPLVGQLDAFVELDSGLRGGVVDVGFGPLGHIALWHEYGWNFTLHKPGKQVKKFIPPKAFMRKSFEASADQAIDAFVETLATVLTSEYGATR